MDSGQFENLLAFLDAATTDDISTILQTAVGSPGRAAGYDAAGRFETFRVPHSDCTDFATEAVCAALRELESTLFIWVVWPNDVIQVPE